MGDVSMNLADTGLAGLPSSAIAVAVAGVFVGALLRGFTGFGLPLAAVPALTLVLAPALAVPAMLLLQIVATLQALPRIYRSIHWPALAWLGLGAAVGLPGGTALLAYLPADAMRLLIGLVMLIAVAVLWRGLRFAHMPGVPARLGIGAIAGVMSGAAAMPGPPVVVFFLASPATAAVSRASLQLFFMMTALASLALAGLSGLVSWSTVMLALVLTPALVLGTWAGDWLFRRTAGRNYRPVALAVLLVIGLAATARALWGMLAA